MERAPARILHPVPSKFDALARMSRRSADACGLRDFTVVVDEDPAADGALADVRVDLRRSVVALRFCEGFEALDPAEQRHAIAHELVHVHVERMTVRVMTLADELGGTAWRIFWSGFSDETERVVDALAAVVAPQLPPVEW